VSVRTLVRGGCVLTLGVKTPNLTQGDVLIVDGLIAEVGAGLRDRDAEAVDVTGTIVMPGFVDTHRHAWRSLFRNLGEATTDDQLRTIAEHHMRPEDVYAATLVGLLGAAEAGITTVVDWSPLPDRDGLAEAALRAHADAGLRTVFATTIQPDAEAIGRLTAVAGPSTAIACGTSLTGPDDPAARWRAARSLGLRIHAHAGGASVPGSATATRSLLAEDVTLVHPVGFDGTDLEAIAGSGSAVSLAPSSEMADGRGAPPIQELIDRDIRPGLGVDDERVTPGDLFAQMRATISMQHATVFDRKLAGKAGLPKLMSTRDAIRFGTVDGARAIGLGGVTGSIEPGMQADIVVLATDRANIFPVNDPIGAVVWGMDTSNVVHVLVAGRFVVRDGRLVADARRATEIARDAHDHVMSASGLRGSAA
jgi:cytosine/adenosine deaminase-related metal-dependent hydrolase